MQGEELLPAALLFSRAACVVLAGMAGFTIWSADRNEEDQSAAAAMLGGLTALAASIVWVTLGGRITDAERTIVYVALAALLWGLRRYVVQRARGNAENRRLRSRLANNSFHSGRHSAGRPAFDRERQGGES